MILKGAIWEPIPEIDDGALTPDAPSLMLHTAVSNASDLYSFWKSGAAGPGVGSQGYVNKDGTLYQYLDSTRKTGHAFAANAFSFGLESWDGALTIPWNDAQLATIIDVAVQLGVPAQSLREDGKGGGVGYHRQYASWNLNSHTCPGDLRVAQVPGIIQAIGDNMADTYGDMLAKAGLGIGDAAGNENWETGRRFFARGILTTDPLYVARAGSVDFVNGYEWLRDHPGDGSGGGLTPHTHAVVGDTGQPNP